MKWYQALGLAAALASDAGYAHGERPMDMATYRTNARLNIRPRRSRWSGVAPEPSNPLNDRSTMIKIMEYMVMDLWVKFMQI
jgi:hypothetical protein